MPKHGEEHMKSMAQASAATRRFTKIRNLLHTAPPLRKDHVEILQTELAAHPIQEK